MRPYSRAPDLEWSGHLHGTGCLSAWSMHTGFPTVVWRLCLVLGLAVTPPFLAGFLGGCAWVRVLVSSLHSWLGFGMSAVRLRFWLAARHFWLGFWGVRGCVRALPAPCRSWLGCAVRVCVHGLGSRLRPPTPGWGFGVCVCFLCARPFAPRQSWLGWFGVCVFVCALCVYSATPGWGVRCGCVCLCSGFGCARPHLAGVFGRVCVCVHAPLVTRHSWLGCAVWVWVLGLGSQLRPATAGWVVWVCVCLCARSICTTQFVAAVCCVVVCALARFRLRPATHGWDVGVCVCLCARSACTPPILDRVCCVVVCAWARVSAALCHSWLGCWGVCVCLCALLACTPHLLAGVCDVWVGCRLAPVPVLWFVAGCARSLGLRHPVAVVAWHLSLCLGCGRRRATSACLVAPRWCAAPRPVRSLPVLRSAALTPWCSSPPRGLVPLDLLGGCAGHLEAGREPGSLCLPAVAAEAAAVGFLCVPPFRGRGLSLAGPSGVRLGLRALRGFVCVDPVTDAFRFPYRPSFDGGLARCIGAVSCGRQHRPFQVRGRHARVPCVCVCACPSTPGRTDPPPGRVLVRLTFSCGHSQFSPV